ncbi:hypothetical protein V6X63_08580 [Spiribacter sp. 221]|uniref:CAF17-like 4Fe-4S cluster assembly/insertion protein YgfZ n=1 Tax=Spiribacter onubensis TaxID=3122420 RepID=UPI00349F59B0
MPEPLPTVDEMEMALADSGIVCPLPSLGVLHVAGEDSGEFLHNQLTQAVNSLDESTTTLAAWCNPKGRTRALFRVVPSDTGLLLIADAGLLQAIQPKLQMFILRSRVALTDLTPAEALLGLAGPVAETLLTEAAGSLPSQPDGLARAGDLHIIALPGDRGLRYVLLAPKEQTKAFWERFRDVLTEGSEAFWQLQDIRAGLPAISNETSGSIIPTMLNLEPLGGISYVKGCYPGQEVVARMHYRGRLKRRLYRARVTGDPPPPGTPVNDSEGGEAGLVVSAAGAPGGRSEMLAVLRIDKAGDGELTANGTGLELLDLPYPPPA